jgi:hypothetical protein
MTQYPVDDICILWRRMRRCMSTMTRPCHSSKSPCMVSRVHRGRRGEVRRAVQRQIMKIHDASAGMHLACNHAACMHGLGSCTGFAPSAVYLLYSWLRGKQFYTKNHFFSYSNRPNITRNLDFRLISKQVSKSSIKYSKGLNFAIEISG